MHNVTRKIKFATPLILILVLILTMGLAGARGDEADKTAVRTDYDDAARFFAGKDIPESSKLHAFTKSRYYQNYKNQITVGWDKFQKPNLDKIKGWWSTHAPKTGNKKILYPFSGPDIMNALAFFPDGEVYYLFGLEKPGLIPEPQGMKEDRITAGLNGLKNSLSTIFHYNFFRTNSMKVELGNNSFNSITGLLMLFLSINDYRVTGVRRVAIDTDSALVNGIESDNGIEWEHPPKSRRVPGVEISFRKDNGVIKKIRYFMLNVIDNALAKNSPNFVPFILKEGPYRAIIKSASYLMHNDKFSLIRDAILKSCDLIVQDDSGIPLSRFTAGEWKVQLHGYYDRPIDLFGNRFQKELREATKKYSTGKLPFSYGYNFKEGEANLLTAEKIKEN